MVPYFGLAGIASNYNENYDKTYAALQLDINANALLNDIMNDSSLSLADEPAEAEVKDWYDQCGKANVDWVTADVAALTSTGWTTAFKYNAIIYMILMIFTLLIVCCMVIPGVPPPAAYCCTVCAGIL